MLSYYQVQLWQILQVFTLRSLILGNKIVLEEHTCMGVTRLEAGTG